MNDNLVWAMPCLSHEFSEGPVLRQPSFDTAELAYDFQTETGAYEWEEITFTGVAAIRFTFTRFCTPHQVSAYDKLVEIRQSTWAASLESPTEGLKHFMIYFDDVGCYEVLARMAAPPTG